MFINDTYEQSNIDDYSGDYYSGNFTNSTNVEDSNNKYIEWYIFVIVCSPCILFALVFILELLKNCIKYMYNSFKPCCYELYNEIVYKVRKYKIKKRENKEKIIVNNKLSNKYIIHLKKKNRSKFIEKYNNIEELDMTCLVCHENMNISGKKLIYLNCGHAYHIKCIQIWVETKIKNVEKPTCPICRSQIIDEKDKEIQEKRREMSIISNNNYSDLW